MSSSISPPRFLHPLLAIVLTCATMASATLPIGSESATPFRTPGPSTLGADLRSAPRPTVPVLSAIPDVPTVAPGSAVTFSANWSGSGPNCTLVQGWYRWSIAPNSTGLNLAPSTGANVSGVAWSATLHVAEVLVRAAAVLSCGRSSFGLVGVAYSNVTVVPPLSLEALALSTNPTRPSQTLNLTGEVAGGAPPYTARIVWGDGAQQVLEVAGPGSFSVPHAFPDGTFRPSVFVTDTLEDVANATVDQALAVGTDTVIGVTPSSPLAEPGVLLWLNGTVLGPRPGSLASLTCGDDGSVDPAPAVTEATCRPAVAGNLSVEFEVYNPLPPLALIDRFSEPVAPRLNVSISSYEPSEVGVPLFLRVAVAGGIPPLVVEWGSGPQDPPLDGSPAGRITLLADGTFLVPNLVATTGSSWTEAQATDAEGVVADSVLFLPPAASDLSLSLVPETVSAGEPSTCGFTATTTGGAAPYLWAVSGDQPFSPGDALLGESASPASQLNWSGRLLAEGPASLSFESVDADGAVRVANLTCALGPPLTGTLSARWTVGANGPAAVANVSLSGGSPPFTIAVLAPNGTVAAAVEASDGNYTLPVSSVGPTATTLTLTVTDALGYALNISTTLLALPPPSPPPSTSPGSEGSGTSHGGSAESVTVTVLVGLAVVATVLLLRRHRRPRRTGFQPPDPEATVRSILSPADGADRLTIELMAEETGIPLDVVRATIDRLIASGQIRSETTPDGEEALAWASPPEP